MARERRRWRWLVVAALLLAAGAWLMTSAEPERAPRPADVKIPRRMMAWEERRNDERAVWAPPQVVTDAGLPEAQRPRDPVIAALPPTVTRAAVVFEANAIRNSALGDLMVQCLFEGEEGLLDTMRDAGLDPLTQVDRVTIVDDDLLMGGPLADVIASEDERLAQALKDAARSVELHVDVSHDVGLAAEVNGSDPAKTEELRKTVGTALALARARAAAQGKNDQAQVLDLAHVAAREDDGFRFEAGLPHDLLEKSLEKCVENRRARKLAKLTPPDAG